MVMFVGVYLESERTSLDDEKKMSFQKFFNNNLKSTNIKEEKNFYLFLSCV